MALSNIVHFFSRMLEVIEKLRSFNIRDMNQYRKIEIVASSLLITENSQPFPIHSITTSNTSSLNITRFSRQESSAIAVNTNNQPAVAVDLLENQSNSYVSFSNNVSKDATNSTVDVGYDIARRGGNFSIEDLNLEEICDLINALARPLADIVCKNIENINQLFEDIKAVKPYSLF